MDLLYNKVRGNQDQVLKLIAGLRERADKAEDKLAVIETKIEKPGF